MVVASKGSTLSKTDSLLVFPHPGKQDGLKMFTAVSGFPNSLTYIIIDTKWRTSNNNLFRDW